MRNEQSGSSHLPRPTAFLSFCIPLRGSVAPWFSVFGFSAFFLCLLGLASGCTQDLKGRIRDGSIEMMKRYSVAGKTYADNELWLVQSRVPLAGDSYATKAVLAWLDSFKTANDTFTFDPITRVDFLTGKSGDDYGIYLNKKANRCYICHPALSSVSSMAYQCDPQLFAEVDRILLDQPEGGLPETLSGDNEK